MKSVKRVVLVIVSIFVLSLSACVIDDGKILDDNTVLTQLSETHVQWRFANESTWHDLIPLTDLADGNDEHGETIELLTRVNDTHIQWQIVGDSTWYDLVPLSELGKKSGEQCENGLTPYIGENGNWWIGNVDTNVFAGYSNDYIVSGTNGLIFSETIHEDSYAYVVTDYFGIDTDVFIPEFYKNVPVTRINNSAFTGSKITGITIPTNVTSIGVSAFSGCDSLTSVSFGYNSQLKTIENSAFNGCSRLATVTFGYISKLESIGYSAFNGCSSLTDVVLSNKVQDIGDFAFKGCKSLTSITIPESVTIIGAAAFSGCSGLTSVELPFLGQTRTSTSTSAYFGYIFGTESYDGSYLANGHYLPRVLLEVKLTDATQIGERAFELCDNITTIILPNTLTTIGNFAFRSCFNLSSVEIGNSVSSIGNSAFEYCTNLTSIAIPKSVTSIGESAFYGCISLPNIVIPNTVTSMGNYTFYNCNNLTISCEATTKPSGWGINWNISKRPVVWGYIE